MFSFIVKIHWTTDLLVADCRCDTRKTKIAGKTEKTTSLFIAMEQLGQKVVWKHFPYQGIYVFSESNLCDMCTLKGVIKKKIRRQKLISYRIFSLVDVFQIWE